jgi:translation initiation factor 1 (eIF-1/SUI1)
MRISTCIFLFLCIAHGLMAQQRRGEGGQGRQVPTITGKIVEAATQEPLIGANVMIKTPEDSLVSNTVTDSEGVFSLAYPRLPAFKLEISYIGYERIIQNISRGTPLDLGTIALREDSKLLGEVVIEGQAAVGEMKGDTAVFNASAFKTRENAMAEDLIGKLPGVTIENGQVQAQGEQVQKVLVDGREFFGSDPSIALRNLPWPLRTRRCGTRGSTTASSA